jgi:hypothetical protein
MIGFCCIALHFRGILVSSFVCAVVGVGYLCCSEGTVEEL